MKKIVLLCALWIFSSSIVLAQTQGPNLRAAGPEDYLPAENVEDCVAQLIDSRLQSHIQFLNQSLTIYRSKDSEEGDAQADWLEQEELPFYEGLVVVPESLEQKSSAFFSGEQLWSFVVEDREAENHVGSIRIQIDREWEFFVKTPQNIPLPKADDYEIIEGQKKLSNPEEAYRRWYRQDNFAYDYDLWQTHTYCRLSRALIWPRTEKIFELIVRRPTIAPLTDWGKK